MSTYSFLQYGEKPLPLLKHLMDEYRKTNPTHPILQAKGFELVAIPTGINYNTFKEQFLKTTAKPNTVYIAILKLGTKQTTIDEIQMTGKCNTNENIVKGARKWETVYVIYRADQHAEVEVHPGKTEAMAAAKQYAMNNDCEVYVELEKRLVGSVSRVADIKPIKKHVKETKEVVWNEFLYFGKDA